MSLNILQDQQETKKVKETKGRYLSWTATKDYKKCGHYFKLVKIDGIDGFQGNIHTAFGNGIHWTVEQELDENRKEEIDLKKTFLKNFEKAISELPEEEKKKIKEDKSLNKLYKEMIKQGQTLVPLLVPALDEKFPGWKLVGVEESFYEKCDFYEESDFYFKGFIDLVIWTPDEKIHVLDWKTSSWGWDSRKKSDPMMTYQLTAYKYFFCLKYKVDHKDVETHFALAKRTAKKNHIEIFRVTSGPRKMKNFLNFLKDVVYNVDHKRFIKNKMSCRDCQFRKTVHCP